MISIVIPFYNEEGRMADYFDPFFERIAGALSDFELIAVDDGSTDATLSMLHKRAAADPRIKVAGYQPNQGRGAAVREGMRLAQGDLIWETDADGSYDVSQCIAFKEFLEGHPGCDVVIATRENKYSKAIVNQPPLRILAGKVFHLIFRLFTGSAFTDVMAGCKVYRRPAAKAIFEHQYDNRYLGAAETVFAAVKLGYAVEERPVTWTDVSGAHIRFLKDTARTLKGLFGICIRNIQGKYSAGPSKAAPGRAIFSFAVAAVAIVSAVTIAAPAVYFRAWAGEYRGIDMFKADAEMNYVSQIHEVYDGHPLLGNIYGYEGKDGPPAAQQPLSPIVIAGIGTLFGLDAPGVNLLTKFLFPLLLFLVLYKIFRMLTPYRSIALAGAVFFVMAPATVAFYDPLSLAGVFGKAVFPGQDYQFLYLYRSINPQFSSLLLFSYFLFLAKYFFAGEVRKKTHGVLAALALGLSFYTYFFAFTLAAAVTALLFALFLLRRNWPDARRLFWISLAGIAIALPSAAMFFIATRSPYYAEMAARLGQFNGHTFFFSRIWFLAVAALALGWRWIRTDALRLFATAFLAAIFVLTNQQVITGHGVPVPAHYHWYYVLPFSGFLFMAIAADLLFRFLPACRRFIPALSFAAIVLFLAAGALFQYRSYVFELPYTAEDNRYADAISWLRDHAQPEEVVFSSGAFANLLTAYTPLNAYFHPGMTDYLLPTEKFEHALFANMYLSGVSKTGAKQWLADNRDMVGSWVYGEYYRQKSGCKGCFSDEVLANLSAGYAAFLAQGIVPELNRYRLDYVVWDTLRDPNWPIAKLPVIKLHEQDGIAVYRYGPNSGK